MSLKHKMFLSMGLLLLASSGCIAYGFYGSASIIDKTDVVRTETYPVLDTANQLTSIVNSTKHNFIVAFEGRDDNLLEDVTDYKNSFIALLSQLKAKTGDVELDEIEKTYLAYIESGEKVIVRYVETEDYSTVEDSLEQLGTSAFVLNNLILSYHNKKYLSFTRALDNIEAQSQDFKKLFLSFGFILLLVVLFLFVVMIGVFNSLSELISHAKMLGEGNLDQAVIVERRDELGYLALTFESMRCSLKELFENLDNKVSERTAQLRASEKEVKDILDAIDQGIFTFTPNLDVNKEHSQKAEDIFNTEDFKAVDLNQVLGLNTKQITEFKNWLDMVCKMPIVRRQWHKYSKLCPVDELNNMGKNRDRIVKIQFSPIEENNQVQKFMLLATDVTEQRRADTALRKTVKEQASFTSNVIALINVDPSESNQFIERIRQFDLSLIKYRQLDNLTTDQAELFRSVHTLKGHSGTLGFIELAGHLAQLENQLHAMREHQAIQLSDWVESIDQLGGGIKILLALRERLFEGYHSSGLLIDGAAYEQLLEQLRIGMNSGKNSESAKIYRELFALNSQPFAFYCKKYNNLISKLRMTENKTIDDLVVETPHELVNREFMKLMDDALVHIIRNAIDHGIEQDEERKTAGKAAGQIRVSYQLRQGQQHIYISDDGRGMETESIAKRALQLGVANDAEIRMMTEKEKLRLIYRAGFSSKDQVTELSGRGVGLDAVYTTLVMHGGGVDVKTIVGQGTTFHLYLPENLEELKVQMAS